MFTVAFQSTQNGRIHRINCPTLDACGRFVNHLLGVSIVQDIKVFDTNGDRVYNFAH